MQLFELFSKKTNTLFCIDQNYFSISELILNTFISFIQGVNFPNGLTSRGGVKLEFVQNPFDLIRKFAILLIRKAKSI